MRTKLTISIPILLALFVIPVWGQDTKAAKAAQAKPAAKSQPYNEKTDAKADLQSALERAKHENRRVLIQWGGNWCGWCVLLHDRFKTDAGLRRKLLYEYDVVYVDIGKMDKNLDLVKKYEAKLSDGVPYLTILDANDKVLANQRTDPFETKSEDGTKGHDPKKLLEFLTQHEAKPLVAAEVLQAGLEKAEKNDRLVFLHFGAPWCGWCHRLENWMAKPEVKAILEKEFVDVKIDTDRMQGGKEVLQRYNEKAEGGIPWFAFVDSKGKALATSVGPKGNVGFPYEPAEIEHFMKMLQTTKRRLTEQDLEKLQASLNAERTPKGQ